MKKTLVFMVLLTLFAALSGGKPCPAMADDPIYTAYYQARAEARVCDRTGDTACAVALYLKAEAAALKQAESKADDDTVNWIECADWQRNNAGYCLIMKQADAKKRDEALLREALAILTAREITSPKVLKVLEKNIKYCETQLDELDKSP